MKIEYNEQTSLPHFMDQYTIQRMERIIYFESNCTPQDKKLIEAAEIIKNHLKAVWGIE